MKRTVGLSQRSSTRSKHQDSRILMSVVSTQESRSGRNACLDGHTAEQDVLV